MTKLPAYTGSEPYVFVCYAHKDQKAIHAEISWLDEQGVNVWYDEGISPGAEWTDELAERIQHCDTFLYFVTPNSVESDHCRREVNFAIDENRKIVAVHLRETELPSGLRLSLNNRQAIHAFRESTSQYRNKLIHSIGKESPPSRHPTPPRNTKTLTLAAVALLAIVGVWFLASTGSTPEEVADPNEAALEHIANFENVSLNFETLQSIGDNIAEEDRAVFELDIRQRLARVDGISLDPKGEYRLDGTIEQLGDRVNIEVRLFDQNDRELWSNALQGPTQRRFALNRDIVLSISVALGRSVNLELQDRLGYRSSEHPSALVLYERARGAGIGSNDANNSIAIELLHEALSFDPQYADAHALLARAYRWNYIVGHQNALALAEQHADLAIEFDPDNVDAYEALGGIYVVQGKIRSATETFRRAIVLDSSTEHSMQDLSHALSWTRELESSLDFALRALELRPDEGNTIYHLTVPLFILDPTRTQRLVDAALAVTPVTESNRLRAVRLNLQVLNGNTEAARTNADRLAYLGERFGISEASVTAAWAFWALGDTERAAQTITDLYRAGKDGVALLPTTDRAETLATQLSIVRTNYADLDIPSIEAGNDNSTRRIALAGIYALLGDTDSMLSYLDQAHDLGFRAVDILRVHPAFQDVQDNPAFQSRLDRMERDLDRIKRNAENDGLFAEVDQVILRLEARAKQTTDAKVSDSL